MDIRITFCGAAGNVTGSRYLVEANGQAIFIDCGLFQEWKFKQRNWEATGVPATEATAVLLTHGHLDHCGLLPRLVQQGFGGSVYCTEATADIAAIVMADAAHIQEEDARFKAKRHRREGRRGRGPVEPLYTTADAEQARRLLRPCGFDEQVAVGPGISARFVSAGHILGAASIELRIRQGEEERLLLFSGDVGSWDMPILEDPVAPRAADYLWVESTYGDRDHDQEEPVAEQLARIINDTCDAGGNLLIPSFAVERAQDLLYHLSGLLHAGRIPPVKVYLDSPMAIRVTDVFRRNEKLFDADAREMLRRGDHPCDFPGLTLCRTRRESKAINEEDAGERRGGGGQATKVIIAGSGMCTAGRIKHHLAHYIDRPETTLLFVGYQASGTLGRRLLNGEKQVRLFGRERRVRARVEALHGLSAHADRGALLRWLSALETPPRHIFVTHGEADAADAFAQSIRERWGHAVSRPDHLDQVVLD